MSEMFLRCLKVLGRGKNYLQLQSMEPGATEGLVAPSNYVRVRFVHEFILAMIVLSDVNRGDTPRGMKMATLVVPDHSGFSRETERSPSPPITSPR